MAIVRGADGLNMLTFGLSHRQEAVSAILSRLSVSLRVSAPPRENSPCDDLIGRLQAYADGFPDDFRSVQLDLSGFSTFQRRVIEQCRKIPYGQTVTYGELAAKVGSPRAARAVGNCMAANPFPLVVPCHRVVPSSGGVGSYSAPGCAETKRRLLAMESAGQAETRNRRQMLVHAKRR
jgi:methylated-DNA-[protein]-cysteine S-methyltransferase